MDSAFGAAAQTNGFSSIGMNQNSTVANDRVGNAFDTVNDPYGANGFNAAAEATAAAANADDGGDPGDSSGGGGGGGGGDW